MAVISVRVSEEEKQTMLDFAKFNGQTVSKLLRDTFFEKIEDEYDMKVIEEYEREKANGSLKLYSLEDILKKHGGE